MQTHRTLGVSPLILMLTVLCLFVGCTEDTSTRVTPHCLHSGECANESLCHPTQHICVTAMEFLDAMAPEIPTVTQDMTPSADPTPIPDTDPPVIDASSNADARLRGDAASQTDDAGLAQQDGTVMTDAAESMDAANDDDALSPNDSAVMFDATSVSDAATAVMDDADIMSPDAALRDVN